MSASRQQIIIFHTALDVFRLEVGRLPTESEGLQALVQRPPTVDASAWQGPYLSKKVLPKDPWGNQYVYLYPGIYSEYEVVSPGRDNTLGTADDININDPSRSWLEYYGSDAERRRRMGNLLFFTSVCLWACLSLVAGMLWGRYKT